MKKLFYSFSFLLVSALLVNTAYAQTPQSQSSPRPLSDKTMSDRLQKDLSNRNSGVSNQQLNWFESNDGFYTNYSINNEEYMTRYDKQGNYIESMRKKVWNDQVPANIRTSFDNSNYKSQKVSGYWELSDNNRKGYYMELKDDNGKMTKVWVDDKGKFSSTPFKGKPNN